MVNLINIARGAIIPIKVDPKMQRVGPYTRVQIDIDCSMELPVEILVQMRMAYFYFFVNLYYEFVPCYCHGCKTISHNTEDC